MLKPVGFEKIDLQDSSTKQVAAAKENVPFIENYFISGFQDFKPSFRYDCIWLQWFVQYLTDDDLINALSRCRESLTFDEASGKRGIIFIKENVTDEESSAYYDRDDSSIVRSKDYFEVLFETAGLEVMHTSLQEDWDPELFPLRMWVLRAKRDSLP